MESIKLTRNGWIKHLMVVRDAVALVAELYDYPAMSSVFPKEDCEIDRDKNIAKMMRKLQEQLWETCAVAEKYLRERKERGETETDELVEPIDLLCDREVETRRRFICAAQRLENLARSLWIADVVTEIEVPGEGDDNAPEGESVAPTHREEIVDNMDEGDAR